MPGPVGELGITWSPVLEHDPLGDWLEKEFRGEMDQGYKFRVQGGTEGQRGDCKPRRQSQDMQQGLPGGGATRKSKIQTCREAGHEKTEQGEKAGIVKAQVNLSCFTSDCRKLGPGRGPRGFHHHSALEDGGHLPHHLTAGTCVQTPAAPATQLSGCGRARPPGKKERK